MRTGITIKNTIYNQLLQAKSESGAKSVNRVMVRFIQLGLEVYEGFTDYQKRALFKKLFCEVRREIKDFQLKARGVEPLKAVISARISRELLKELDLFLESVGDTRSNWLRSKLKSEVEVVEVPT